MCVWLLLYVVVGGVVVECVVVDCLWCVGVGGVVGYVFVGGGGG